MDVLRRNLTTFMLLSLGCCAAAVGAERATYAGRPVTSVLNELSDSGLRFLYSSELVPDSLRVLREPVHRDRLRLVREILAAHGLVAAAVRGPLYVIKRAKPEPQARVVGRVLDADTGEPIPNARVELMPLGLARSTDSDGRFKFEGVPVSNYGVQASAPDYAAVRSPGGGTDLTLRLPRAPLADIIVAASRYRLGEMGAGSAFQLPHERLTSQPSIGDDPLRSISRLPGFATDGISGPPNIRGGATDEVLVLLDGFPLRQAYHMPGYQSLLSILDENVINTAEIFTGGFGARYGNRLSGVFDLASSASPADARRSVGVSLVNASASWADTLDRGNGDMLLAARVGTAAVIMQRLSPETGVPRFADAFARFGFDVTPTLRIHASTLWAQDNLRVDDDDENARFTSTSDYLWTRADWSPAETFGLSLWLGYSTLDSARVGRIDKEDLLIGSTRDVRHGTAKDFRAQLDWQPGSDHRLSAGAEWTTARANYDYASEAMFGEEIAALFARDPAFSRAIELQLVSRQLGVFISDRWHISDRWSAELGLRAQRTSYSTGASETGVDPRFSLRVMLAPGTALRMHVGRFHQADEAIDLHVEDGMTEPAGSRRSEHAIIGFEHEWRTGLRVRAEAFRKRGLETRMRFENLLSRLDLLPELSADRVALASGKSELTGFEVSLNFERDDWNSWMSLTRSTATDEYVARESPRSWDQAWAAQLGMQWRRGPWTLSAAYAWHSGFPTTAIVTLPDGGAELGRPYAARLPAFSALDLHAAYRRPLARGSLVVSLDVTNAANRRNVCCSEVEIEGEDEPRIFTETQRGMPLLPSLGVRWEY